MQPPSGYPVPKVKLLPTFYFPSDDGFEAVTDSTPIISRLEADYEGRSVRPQDAAVRFVDLLIEDYADEWVTKAMFHYRWAHEADARNAGPLLTYWCDTTVPDEEGRNISAALTRRQQERLYVVGSNETTAARISRR
jgi:glutathione S-transferase